MKLKQPKLQPQQRKNPENGAKMFPEHSFSHIYRVNVLNVMNQTSREIANILYKSIIVESVIYDI